MHVNRLKHSIVTHPLKALNVVHNINHYTKDKYSEIKRYEIAKKNLTKIFKAGKINVISTFEEDLPSDTGYIMYANHQGKADTIAIILSHEAPCTVVIDKAVCTNFFLNSFLDLIKAKKLDKEDPRSAIKLFKEVEEEITNDSRRYIIFPEGKHDNNGNNLQEFMTGSMGVAFKTKCPIIPVCLYDTYKVYEVPDTKKVTCEVHFLKPIYYDEYKELRKNELSLLIRNKIETKLNELKNRNLG